MADDVKEQEEKDDVYDETQALPTIEKQSMKRRDKKKRKKDRKKESATEEKKNEDVEVELEEGKEVETTDKSEEEMAAANVSEVEEEKTVDTKKSKWSTVVVTLSQLLDLALGTPEVGVINLNILHNFLHVLLQQVNLRTTRVEFRGTDAKRIGSVIALSKSGPDLYIYENKIISGSNQMKKRIHSTDQFTITVDVVKQDEPTVGKSVSAPVSPQKDKKQATDSAEKVMIEDQSINLDLENNIESRVYVESVVDGLTPTASAFKQLEENVQRLEKQFEALQELSTNSELIERLKGNLTDPLTDVWNIININKRLDAAEQGISKLTSMMQEVIKNQKNIKTLKHNMTQTKKKIISTDVEGKKIETGTDDPAPESDVDWEEETANKKEDKDEERETFINICIDKFQDLETNLENEVYKLHVDLVSLKEEKDRIDKEVKELSNTIKSIGSENIEDTLNKIEKFTESNIEDRIEKLEHDNILLMDNFVAPNLSPTDKFPLQDIEEKDLNNMISKTQEIQDDIKKLNETANFLMKDTADRNDNLNAILEQLQYLQTIKADKDHVNSSLASKADADTVNRKVSHDKFDIACNDLTEEIQQALEHIDLQNSKIVQHFAEIQKEIEKKVNKIEVAPLQQYVNKQLNDLRERISQMLKAKVDMEAAGTKKMLSGVQCISCNKETKMRMEEIGRFEAPAMPSTRSIKPCLSYALDQIRKQKRTLPYSKDVNKLEAVMLEIKNKSPIHQSTSSDNGCERYCGGSHTITIPEKKVKRISPTFYSRGNVRDMFGTLKATRRQTIEGESLKRKCNESKMSRSQSLPPKDVCTDEVPSSSTSKTSPSASEIPCPNAEVPKLSEEKPSTSS